jgi:arylsulfatase A-like enzyme
MLYGLAADPDTLLIALADHGGGGADACDHDSAHPLDRTIPLLLWGAGIGRTHLLPSSLIDVPPTILHALGVEVPEWYEGRVLHEAFARNDTPEPAVA